MAHPSGDNLAFGRPRAQPMAHPFRDSCTFGALRAQPMAHPLGDLRCPCLRPYILAPLPRTAGRRLPPRTSSPVLSFPDFLPPWRSSRVGGGGHSVSFFPRFPCVARWQLEAAKQPHKTRLHVAAYIHRADPAPSPAASGRPADGEGSLPDVQDHLERSTSDQS